ncbi:MAG: SelB C-terminal domain-containing protein [Acidobacteria bacterium]|nr:SelB C-terminal domain-containing protein [Acidobacteriota bacterium]
MLINSGELIKISDLVFHRSSLEKLKVSIQNYKLQHGPKIDVAAFKDLTGVSRKYAIPLLEFMDRQRITRRNGDVREIL